MAERHTVTFRQQTKNKFTTGVIEMETIIAILVYFGLMTFGDAQMSPGQIQYEIQNNQPLIRYYSGELDELKAIRAQIDRQELN